MTKIGSRFLISVLKCSSFVIAIQQAVEKSATEKGVHGQLAHRTYWKSMHGSKRHKMSKIIRDNPPKCRNTWKMSSSLNYYITAVRRTIQLNPVHLRDYLSFYPVSQHVVQVLIKYRVGCTGMGLGCMMASGYCNLVY